MKPASKIRFLLFGLLIIYGCTNNKEFKEKYGIAFNKVRKENHIPLLLENWGYCPSWSFHRISLAWSSSEYLKGYAKKTIYLNRKKKIYCETDLYYSGRIIKSFDPDCGTDNEQMFIKYYFDGTEKKVIKVVAHITTDEKLPDKGDLMGNITLKQAKEFLVKWGIKVDELDYNIEKFPRETIDGKPNNIGYAYHEDDEV